MAVEFNVRNVDTNSDGTISEQEWNKWYKDNIEGRSVSDGTSVKYVSKDGTQTINWKKLQEMQKEGNLAKAAEPKVPEKLDKKGMEDLRAKIATFDREIDKLKADLEKADKEKTKDAKKASETIQKKLTDLQKKQRQNVKIYEAQMARDGQKSKLAKKTYNNANMRVPEHLGGKAKKGGGTVTIPGAKAQTLGKGGTPKSSGYETPGAKAQTGGWGTFPANWGAMTMAGPKLNTVAYSQLLSMESHIGEAWDSIFKNRNDGERLKAVLMYWMRMVAASGDMGAVYQMMKAVLYIISKDKALQQVHMANRLIELQDASRRATDRLLSFKLDPNDTMSQTAHSNLMQSVRSEESSIATSQKLIAQMMEEMAQVVETLNSTTMNALAANGRILRVAARPTT